MLHYPEYFTKEERENFDFIRQVAISIGAGCLIVKENDITVLIEIPRNEMTPEDIDALDKINTSGSRLLADIIFHNAPVPGGIAYELR